MHNKIRALLPSIWLEKRAVSVREQERLRKQVRSRVGRSSLDPMIIQSRRRQREAVDDYVNISEGAGMHLQCNCRHWAVVIIIIIIIMYRLFTYVFSFHTTPSSLLPFRASSSTLDSPRWICYLHSAASCRVFILYSGSIEVRCMPEESDTTLNEKDTL